MRPLKMFFTHTAISPLETLRLTGGVGLSPVLKGRMNPILDGLNQPTAEAYSNSTVGQPLRLQLLLVVQQRL
jgi:hypothetical protein